MGVECTDFRAGMADQLLDGRLRDIGVFQQTDGRMPQRVEGEGISATTTRSLLCGTRGDRSQPGQLQKVAELPAQARGVIVAFHICRRSGVQEGPRIVAAR